MEITAACVLPRSGFGSQPEGDTKMTSQANRMILAALLTGGVALSPLAHADSTDAGDECLAMEETNSSHVNTFDYLDFKVFDKQKWELLHLSHAADVRVHWPDGHVTVGIDTHIADLKGFFVWAPDTQVAEHAVETFGGGAEGDDTGCVGTFTGTFTRPMPIGGGNFIQPTGKSFKINFATVGIWNAEGTMSEEYLFWDNQEFYRQIGL
jgi:hypothetical protein